MRKIYHSPSLMCLDYLVLKEELDRLHQHSVDYLHVDIMDGRYVPNMALGTDFCRQIKAASSIPLDMHFMVEEIDRFLPYFDLKDALVSFHPETSHHPLRTIQMIRNEGGKPGIAIDPAYDFKQYSWMFNAVDFVLIMSVNPGYAGQRLIPSSLEKIRLLRRYLDANDLSHIPIEVDGNVSWENIPKMLEAGSQILVTGTSSVFSSDLERNDALMRFNQLIGRA